MWENDLHLRIPDSYDAKIAKIRYFETFWPIIQLIKDGSLAEIWARMSRSCRFLLFLHDNYQVSLTYQFLALLAHSDK